MEVKIPELGESITEATVGRWLKSVGDAVSVDEALVELETDKVNVEVPSPVAGVLEACCAAEGEDVAIGFVIARVKEGAATGEDVAVKEKEATPPESVPQEAVPQEAVSQEAVSQEAAPSGKVGPGTEKLMKESGVSMGEVRGSGPRGNVVNRDVHQALGEKKATSSDSVSVLREVVRDRKVDSRGEEVVKMSRLRKKIASRLKEAQNTAAMLTTFNEVDMTRLMAMRKRYKDGFEKKYGIRLGFMSFFVQAAVSALREFAAVNAEINGDEIIYKKYYDIGIAVGTPMGLVVPILRDADTMGIADVERGIADFGRRAREGKLKLEEMSGGTFTITNGGVFGSLLSTPILNLPQSGILGLHKIQARPIVNDDGEVVVGQMMYVALSYDHRIIDGREAVSFLVRIKEMVEDPARLMMDI
jgi:2-oxoglutarate dehydrogenase E2 component (dihydrolipoamide succinyltransferase)